MARLALALNMSRQHAAERLHSNRLTKPDSQRLYNRSGDKDGGAIRSPDKLGETVGNSSTPAWCGRRRNLGY
jgi:hypothetical protein